MVMGRHDGKTDDEAAKAVLEAFVLRARRIEAHSMVRSGEAKELAVPSARMTLTEGEEPTLRQKVPVNEEVFESLAARLRPLIVKSEPIYLEKVFDAIRRLTTKEGLEKIEPELRDYEDWFAHHVVRKDMASYSIQLLSPDESPLTGMMPDPLLAESWLYSDLVHADPRGEKAQALGLEYEDRYEAASSFYCVLALQVSGLLALVKSLVGSGRLGMDAVVWDKQVTACADGGLAETKPIVNAYVGPAGLIPPEGGDMSSLDGFKRATFVTMSRLLNPERAAEVVIVDSEGKSGERMPSFFSISDEEFTVFIDDRAVLGLPLGGIKADGAAHIVTEPKLRTMRGSGESGAALVEAIICSEEVLIYFRSKGGDAVMTFRPSRAGTAPAGGPA